MASVKVQQGLVLGMSTLAFTVCFMVWMMFAVLGVPVKELLQLNETQFGLLAATPVLTGSLVRLPLGLLTDKFGGRIVFFILMLVCVLPIYMISLATEYWHFLVLGLFVGLAGGSFSVGIAYVAKWFDKSTQGTAMGIFGAGNAGAAVTKFVAPAIKEINDLGDIEIELIEFQDRLHRLQQALSGAEAGQWDICLIDCPPSLGMLTLNALIAAESTLYSDFGQRIGEPGLASPIFRFSE